jgi:hypothetical protein
MGSQAQALGLSGDVTTESLEALLSGHDPSTGMQLGRALVDRFDKHRNTIKAVAGYDATLCAPKSVSVLCGWAGDDGWAECHGIAVNALVEMIEKSARRPASGRTGLGCVPRRRGCRSRCSGCSTSLSVRAVGSSGAFRPVRSGGFGAYWPDH